MHQAEIFREAIREIDKRMLNICVIPYGEGMRQMMHMRKIYSINAILTSTFRKVIKPVL